MKMNSKKLIFSRDYTLANVIRFEQKKHQLTVAFLMNLTDIFKSDLRIYDAADEMTMYLDFQQKRIPKS